MNKNFKYALLSAIALTGAVSFSACSSSDDFFDNPDFNPETKSVKTQFSISLPNYSASKTRMAEADVQGQTTPTFLGMQDIKLIAYTETPVTANSATTTFKSNIQLPSTEIAATGDFTATLATETGGVQKYAKLYSNVEVPVETQGFLFYAQSKATRTNPADKKKSGYLNAPDSYDDPSAIKFTLSAVQTEAPASNTVGKAIATYLSKIAQTTDWSTAASNTNLGQLYTNFTAMRAGSSTTALAAVQKLYTALLGIDGTLSSAIQTNIKNATYASDAESNGTLTFTDAVKGYPANIGLPDGAALLTFEASTNTFSVASATDYAMLNVGNSENYVYPPSLYYVANSGIKTSTKLQEAEYTSANNWSGILAKYTEGTAVTTNTRSVALQNTVEYAVGRLDLRIKTASTLKDRFGKVVTLADGGFPVTAVLIGNQKGVDLNFEPIENETETEKTIYDTEVPSGMKAGSTAYSSYNYTLALETKANEAKYVVVELTNNTGSEFQGKDGIIPVNGKFYMVAELNPTKGTTDTKDNTGGKVFKQDYVTTVDLTINANGDATESSPKTDGLGGAYNVIPDLRSTSFELGLSVNLQWRAGVTFEITI